MRFPLGCLLPNKQYSSWNCHRFISVYKSSQNIHKPRRATKKGNSNENVPKTPKFVRVLRNVNSFFWDFKHILFLFCHSFPEAENKCWKDKTARQETGKCSLLFVSGLQEKSSAKHLQMGWAKTKSIEWMGKHLIFECWIYLKYI